MSKKEFIEQLTLALQGEINQTQINDQISYYENYIMEESRKGKSEAQVIETLGPPRLIAKTIIETTDKLNSTESYSDNLERENKLEGGRSVFKTSYGKIGIIFLVFLFFILITRLIIFLLPLLLLFLCISLVVKFFHKHK